MSNSLIFFYVVVGLVGGLVVAHWVGRFAESKGLSYKRYFILSLFLSMPLAFLIMLVDRDKGSAASAPEIKGHLDGTRTVAGERQARCPECAEFVNLAAKRCKHCGADIAENMEAQRSSIDDSRANEERRRVAMVLEERDHQLAIQRSAALEAARKADAKKAFLRSRKFKIFIASTVVAVVGVVAAINAIAAASAKNEAEVARQAKLHWVENGAPWKAVVNSCVSQLAPDGSPRGRVVVSDALGQILIPQDSYVAAVQEIQECIDSGLVGAPSFGQTSHIDGLNDVKVDHFAMKNGQAYYRYRTTKTWHAPALSPSAVTATSALHVCKAKSGFVLLNSLWLDLYPNYGRDPLFGEIKTMPIAVARCVVKALTSHDPGSDWIGDPVVDPDKVGDSMRIDLSDDAGSNSK